MRAPAHRLLIPGLLAGAFLVLLTGCGGGCIECGYDYYDPYDPYYYGTVDIDNLSLEYVDAFFLAPAPSGLWSGELLGRPLAPGYAACVGDHPEDYYDAEADLEFGDLVQWFDVFVPAADVTVFEVY